MESPFSPGRAFHFETAFHCGTRDGRGRPPYAQLVQCESAVSAWNPRARLYACGLNDFIAFASGTSSALAQCSSNNNAEEEEHSEAYQRTRNLLGDHAAGRRRERLGGAGAGHPGATGVPRGHPGSAYEQRGHSGAAYGERGCPGSSHEQRRHPGAAHPRRGHPAPRGSPSRASEPFSLARSGAARAHRMQADGVAKRERVSPDRSRGEGSRGRSALGNRARDRESRDRRPARRDEPAHFCAARSGVLGHLPVSAACSAAAKPA